MSISSIVLVGLSGNTREFLELVETRFAVKAILSDSPGHGPEFRNIPVAPLNTAREFTDSAFLFLIGSEKSYAIRKKLIADLGVPESRYATLVHPRATVSKDAVLGFGTVLSAGVTVTANARLGNHVMILPNSVVHHDVDVGDCSIIGSNVTIAGDARIGQSCYVGSASSIRNGVHIGDGALIGMAANVVSDVAPGAIMVGNPARPMS